MARRSILPVTAAVCALFCSCVSAGPLLGKSKEAPSYTQPAENILIIVADVQRHLNDDVYRFPYALDVTGQNVFRSGIVRLENYAKLYPGKLKDVVALAKAQAYERLGAYKEAGVNYQEAQKSADAPIKSLSDEGFERCKRFSQVLDQEMDQSGLLPFEKDLQKKIRDLEGLLEPYKGTPYECMVLLARERTQIELAQFYITMRFMQPYSVQDALLQIKRNIDQNKNSKNLYTHHMMLADLYYDLAKEYAMRSDPEGPDFHQKEFDGFANSARAEYHIVEQADGYPEKLEGRAKLLALEAFVERVSNRAK